LGFFVKDQGRSLYQRINPPTGNSTRPFRPVTPASQYYATRQEAIEVAVWLIDRAAGYPYNTLMAEWPSKTGEAFEDVPYERDATYKMGGALWLKTIRRRDFWYECGEGYAHPVGQACVGQCVNRG
jgi:hypothetical protein